MKQQLQHTDTPRGAPTCPTEQTCGVKGLPKAPRPSAQHSQPLAFCCPAWLWECRGGTNPRGSCLSQKQEPTPRATTLSRKTPPPASPGAVREVLVSHQPSKPDPTELRGGVSTSVLLDGRISPALLPFLPSSCPLQQQAGSTAGLGGSSTPEQPAGGCLAEQGWDWEASLGLGMAMVPFGSEGSALAPSTCRGAVPPALSLLRGTAQRDRAECRRLGR